MGISSSSNQIAVTVIQIIQYNSLTYYGALTKYGTDIPLAACGIVMKTNAIILAIIVGISQGTQPIIGFNYGARQYHRVREAYLLAVKWNLVVSTIAFIAFQFFPQSIISLFGDGDELYFEFAVLFMRTYLFMVLVNGVQLLSSSFFTAIGKALKGALLALTRQTFFLIPLTLLLPLRFGIMGVLLAGPVADFSAFVLSIVLVGTELRKQKMQHILVKLVHSKMNGLHPLLTAPPVFAFRQYQPVTMLFVGERRSFLWLTQKHTRNTSCILLTAFAKS